MNKEIGFALIGCGKVAFRHADAIAQTPHARLIAVCDTDDAKAKALSQQASVPYYLDHQQMLKAHPEINVVSLLTPSGLHYEQGMAIIKHFQKHLLIEKPMVLTLAHAKHLKETADHYGVQLFPIYQHRFNKAVLHVKDSIGPDKTLGALRVGTVRVRWCRPQRYYDQSHWRGTFAMDGGALTNQGIHFIDLLRHLCGEVVQVHAKLKTLGAQIEVEDTGCAILEFANGGLGIIEIMTSARPHDFEASISCVCDEGIAVIGGVAANELQTFSKDPKAIMLQSEAFCDSYGFGHNVIINGVVEHCLLQKQPAITYEDGLKTIQLLQALYKSDETNGWIDVRGAGDSKRLGAS